ncbi:immunoglobulin domain protein [Opisthorchis viverrini]|uniref:Immunoglobulin domain protein n=1 Tax=Opisthorchis viverrini TaxID=6198 RepID=A0A1S8WHK6_OPIVI|nr:immunoglobulin domain protein [Opisthorchis viverrini]
MDFGNKYYSRGYEREVTPDVSILDETPSAYTGRVISYPNKTVETRGFIGEKIVMQCNVFNMPRDARIIWRRESFQGGHIAEVINDGLMSRDMSRWKIGQGKQQDSVRLEILSLDETYEGLYTCECQYTGSVEPARIQRVLRVFGELNFFQTICSLANIKNADMSSYDTDANVNDNVVLQCAAEGIPTPYIYWQRTGGQSSIIRNYGTLKSGNEIRFDAVQADDAGEYVCFAENSMGQALWRVQLRVRHPPMVRIYPFEPSQLVNCNLRLVCTISANPPVLEPAVFWTSNRTGSITADTPRTRIQYLNAGLMRHSVLDLLPVTSADFGQMLTCSATNSLGESSSSVVIQREFSSISTKSLLSLVIT